MKVALQLFLIISIFAAGLSQAAETNDAKAKRERELAYRKNVEEGAKYLKQDKKENALGRFSTAIKLIPERAEGHYWMAIVYSDYKNYTEAAEFARKAVESKEKMEKAWLSWLVWGQSLMYLRQWKTAREKLEIADRLSGKDPVVAFNRARCEYHGIRNVSSALQLFKETLRRIGKNKNSYPKIYRQTKFYLGCCYAESDMDKMAIFEFVDFLKLDPENLEAHYRLGVLYRKSKRLTEAEGELKWVVRIKSSHYEAALQLGHMYLKDRNDKIRASYYFKLFLKYSPKEHAWHKRVEKWFEDEKKVKEQMNKKDEKDKDGTKNKDTKKVRN